MVKFFDIVIIGAGFCGTMTAAQLLREAPDLKVALIDRNGVAGVGLAYGTSDPNHLLNVRAGNMTAFPDDPQHFTNWLCATHATRLPHVAYDADDFVPRQIYGDYLRNILDQTQKNHAGLEIIQSDVSAVRRLDDRLFEVQTRENVTYHASQIVLAVGNFYSPATFMAGQLDPYSEVTWTKLAEPGDILIVGTGLTSLDLVITLAKKKPSGQIHLLSRHGLLPREHVDPEPYELTWTLPESASVAEITRAIREKTRATIGSWQAVMDALRPLNQKLWNALGGDSKRRFLRHVRTYWDVHRHRCAPEIMKVVRQMLDGGRLKLHAGFIQSTREQANGTTVVNWRPRHRSHKERLVVKQIVYCTGPQSDLRRLKDPLIQSLIEGGLIKPDDLGLGMATVETFGAAGAKGQQVRGLFTLGSLLKGSLYESVAVPELRVQAEALAKVLVKSRATLKR